MQNLMKRTRNFDNTVVNLKNKISRNNPNLDLVKVNPYVQFDQIPSIYSRDIERKRNFDNDQGHNHFVNLRKLTGNNPNLDLVKINAYATFDQIPSIC